MTRGRKKDLTIPPTRSLVQQRDYRARKAHYVASLEERVRTVEEENAELRKELADAKMRLGNPALLLPETESASAELLHHLTLARDSLANFRLLAFQGGMPRPSTANWPPPLPRTRLPQDEGGSFHQSTFSSNHIPIPPSQPSTSNGSLRGRKRLYVEQSPPSSPTSQATPVRWGSINGEHSHSGGSDEGDGGFDELAGDSDEEGKRQRTSRTSGLRSTTVDSLGYNYTKAAPDNTH